MKKQIIMALLLLAISISGAIAMEEPDPATVFYNNSPMTTMVSRYFHQDPIVVISVGQSYREFPGDVLVNFYLTQKTGTDPFTINKWRKEAMSWQEIVEKLNVNPSMFYISTGGAHIPSEFRHAYGQYHSWLNYGKPIKLYDGEYRNLAGLKFAKDILGYKATAGQIMRARNSGKKYFQIIKTYK
ncbi:MAG: hypothetical protein ACLFQV_05760 [Vulcanimicrobiota bacterium]